MNCRNHLLAISLFLFSGILTAQKLSIEDAVTHQNGALLPKQTDQLQWVKGADTYSLVEHDTLLVIKDIKGKTKKSISLAELNRNLAEESLSAIPSINWINPDSFWFKNGRGIYHYSIKEGSARLASKIVGKAGNVDYNPTSRKLACTIDNNLLIGTSEEVKYITRHEDKGVVSGQAIHRFEFGISKGTFWSEDGTRLAFYEKDERKVTEYPIADYSSSPATAAPVRYPMAGQSSETGTVGIYNTATSTMTYLETRSELGPEHYYTNLAWSPDGSKLYVAEVNRVQNEMHLNVYNGDNGFFEKTLFTEKHEKYVEPEHPVIFLNNDPSSFLWFSERDGFNHLYHYSADGKLIKQLTTGNFPVTAYLGCDANGKAVFVEATGENPLENHIYRVELDGSMSRISTTEGVHHGMLSSSGNYLIDRYSNLNTPAVSQIISSSGKLTSTILSSPDPLSDFKLGKTEFIQLQAEDGTALHARLILPPGFDSSKKYPVLVYVYGGPHLQLVTNSWLGGAPLWMHSMAAEGYIIWSLDGRGSANRGRDFEQAVFRNLGEKEMEDQLSGVNYLKSLSYVDAERMAVHGWSFGGFMTTSLMLRQPGTFKVGVAGGAVIDWSLYEVMYTERYMDTPQENPEGYKQSALTNYVEQLQGDLLMIHGTSDDVVVMQHSMAFLKACVDKGVMVDFFVYPGHAHNVRGKDRVHLMTKVLGYVMERL